MVDARPQTLSESLPGLARVVRQFWPFVRAQRILIAFSALALVAEIGLRLLEPWPLKFVFDQVLSAGQRGHGGNWPFLETLSPLTVLTLAALAVILINGLRALADYTNTVGFSLASTRVLTQVRNELYRHLQGLSLSFHTRARGGDLIVRVIGDVNMLKDVTVTAVLPLLTNLLILVGMFTCMVWLQWQLALLAMTSFPLFWLAVAYFGRRIREAARKQRHREGDMAASAAEAITAIKTVQALSLEGRFAQDFFDRSFGSQQEDTKGSRLSASLGRIVNFLVAVGTALVLWYGAWLVLSDELTPGELLVFLFYLKRAFHPVQDFAKYAGRLARGAAAGERVLNILDRTPEVHDLPGAVTAPSFRGAVRLEGVCFAYEPDRWVLEQIHLDVPAGVHVALVGPSGIGKSTLVSLILRFYDPLQGRVLIDGRDIREYTLTSLRAQISVVLQENLLFASSVRDNIACARPGATAFEVEAAARLAKAHEFILDLPQGYDTLLGERGLTLSQGQRQRIALARAAIRQAPILILDEPATGLDEENESAVVKALEDLSRGKTTFVITHDLKLAARADLILYLDGRRIRERGSHAQLMRAGRRYAALYQLQADSYHPPSPVPAPLQAPLQAPTG